MAASACDLPVNIMVAVGVDGEMVLPCGMWRELVSNDGLPAQVIIFGKRRY